MNNIHCPVCGRFCTNLTIMRGISGNKIYSAWAICPVHGRVYVPEQVFDYDKLDDWEFVTEE